MKDLHKLRNIPIVGWLVGHWAVILAFIGALVLYTQGHLALTARGALLIPLFILMAIVGTTFASNVALRGTSARHRRNKELWEKDWKELTPFQRVIVCKIDVWIIFVIAGLIAASVLLLVNITVAPL